MFTFETADQKEARRFRIAQFNGRTTTVNADGTTVTGYVRSVREIGASIPPRWSITIVPSASKQTRPSSARLARHGRLFAEDYDTIVPAVAEL